MPPRVSLSPAVKALVASPALRQTSQPAPIKRVRPVYQKICSEASERGISPSNWLALTVCTMAVVLMILVIIADNSALLYGPTLLHLCLAMWGMSRWLPTRLCLVSNPFYILPVDRSYNEHELCEWVACSV